MSVLVGENYEGKRHARATWHTHAWVLVGYCLVLVLLIRRRQQHLSVNEIKRATGLATNTTLCVCVHGCEASASAAGVAS